ncbi:MAG: hypothetical protein KDE58_25425, partial [Caldilineaceae bacterium]|nr:hypothetical protein [Caldilineaceae bacterium]
SRHPFDKLRVRSIFESTNSIIQSAGHLIIRSSLLYKLYATANDLAHPFFPPTLPEFSGVVCNDQALFSA